MAAANRSGGADLAAALKRGINYSYNYQTTLATVTAVAGLKPDKPDLNVLRTYFSSTDYTNAAGAVDLSKIAPFIAEAQAARASAPIKKWDRDYEQGYANPTYFERVSFMQWKLKPGKRASEAVKAWMKGPTIAECLSTMIMILVDTYRAAIGDDEFDTRYGDGKGANADVVFGADMRWTPVANMMEDRISADVGTPNARPVVAGDWCYFTNHPKYLLKHPGGAWQGENAICIGVQGGQQIFGGLGATDMTEDAMLDEMVSAYNGDRDEGDQNALDDMKRNGPVPDLYDPAKGNFPDKVTKKDILDEPAYALDGTTRKGGFTAGSIARLDAIKIAAQRPAPKKSTGER